MLHHRTEDPAEQAWDAAHGQALAIVEEARSSGKEADFFAVFDREFRELLPEFVERTVVERGHA